jgi:hypothetical protein
MTLRLLPRVLSGLSGSQELSCSCGGRPEVSQPDESNPDALLGVCGDCSSWTLYVQLERGWRSAQAFELASFRVSVDNHLMGVEIKRERRRPAARRRTRQRAS